MSRKEKLLHKARSSPTNLRFEEFQTLLTANGFTLSRSSGSHFTYTNKNSGEIVTIQDSHGFAKPYQVRQFLAKIEEENGD